MFIWSQRDSVLGVAHSASFEVSSAHAESGTGPSPRRLHANAKMSARLTISILTDAPYFRFATFHKSLYQVDQEGL